MQPLIDFNLRNPPEDFFDLEVSVGLSPFCVEGVSAPALGIDTLPSLAIDLAIDTEDLATDTADLVDLATDMVDLADGAWGVALDSCKKLIL